MGASKRILNVLDRRRGCSSPKDKFEKDAADDGDAAAADDDDNERDGAFSVFDLRIGACPGEGLWGGGGGVLGMRWP